MPAAVTRNSLHVPDARPLETHNRPDEWKIEQGLVGVKIPALDQTGDEPREILPREWPVISQDDEAIAAVGNKEELFQEEREGWQG